MRLLTLFVLLTYLAGCSGKTNRTESASKDTVTSSMDERTAAKMEEASREIEATRDKLLSLTPRTEDEMRAMLPAGLAGASASDVRVSSSAGAMVASAEYTINDEQKIELMIFDCAGPGGAGIYNLQYLSLKGMDEEDDDEYRKTSG